MTASIAFSNLQYEDYAGWWLKAYQPSTTVAKTIYSDKDKTQGFAKVQLDAEGFPASLGARFIPFIEDNFDLYLFPTAQEADDNDTSNTIRLATNINAEKVLPSEVGADLELLSSQEITDYLDRIAQDGYPAATPPPENEVLNGERAIELQDGYFLQERKATQQDVDDAVENKFVDAKLLSENAGGGGGGGLVGDIVLRDETQVDWTNNTTQNQSLLLCDGSRFSDAFYPELAALPDYGTGDDVFTTFTQNAVNTLSTASSTAVRLAHVEGVGTYAFVFTNTSTFEVYKSTDGGATWGSALTITPPFSGFIVNITSGVHVREGTNEIIVCNYGKIAIFDASIDDFTTTDITVFANATPLSIHYNANLSKWVIFYVNNSTDDEMLIFTSTDAVTWTLEYNSEPFPVFDGFTYRGVPSDRCEQYNDGFYYLLGAADVNSRVIYKIDENNLGIFADSVIFSLPASPDLTVFQQVPQPAVNVSGQIVVPYAAEVGSSPNRYRLEYYYSGNKGRTFEKRFITLSNAANYTQKHPFVIGDAADSFVFVTENTMFRLNDNGTTVVDLATGFLPEVSNNTYVALGGLTIARDQSFFPMMVAVGCEGTAINSGVGAFQQGGSSGSPLTYTKDLSPLWSGQLKAWVVTGK